MSVAKTRASAERLTEPLRGTLGRAHGPHRGAVKFGGGALALVALAALAFVSMPGAPERRPTPDLEGLEGGAPPARTPSLARPSSAEEARRAVESNAVTWATGTPVGSSTSRAGESPVVARGQVTCALGALPEEVEIGLYNADGGELEVVFADSEGRFELCCAEPLSTGWSVGTDAPVLLRGDTFLELAPACVLGLAQHLPGDAPREIELRLDLAPALVGRVFDRATGAPIELADIFVVADLPDRTDAELTTNSRADGSFELAVRGLPLRSLSLWCRAEGWQTERVGPFDCRTGGAAGIDFALERPIPWRGRVVALPDGRPVAGATIRVGNRLGSFSALGGGCESDEGGVFDLPLPSCPVEGAWILVTAPGFAPQALRGAKPGGGLVLALRERLTLEGVVATRDGQAMEGAAVRVAFDGLNPADDAELTDAAESTASGAFTLELASAPLDSATIRVEAGGCVRFEAPLADVVEAAGQNRLRARIQLTPSR